MDNILSKTGKVVRILKKRVPEMSSSSGKMSRKFEFLRLFGAAQKIKAKV